MAIVKLGKVGFADDTHPQGRRVIANFKTGRRLFDGVGANQTTPVKAMGDRDITPAMLLAMSRADVERAPVKAPPQRAPRLIPEAMDAGLDNTAIHRLLSAGAIYRYANRGEAMAKAAAHYQEMLRRSLI